MKGFKILILGVLLLVPIQKALTQIEFIENSKDGTLVVRDGNMDVLVYRFSEQLKAGIAQNQVRSCYIHPLYPPTISTTTDCSGPGQESAREARRLRPGCPLI
jgi:hypothetical protein